MDERGIRIVVAGTHFASIKDYLKRHFPDGFVEMVEPERLPDRIGDADVLIPAMCRIDESLLNRAHRLRLIQQWGVGLDGVDIAAASRRNIAVANVSSPGTGNAESVAEWCVMAALCLSREFPRIQEQVRRGAPWGVPTGRSLAGKKAGFVGFGGIGKALAARLRPFGMRMAAVQRTPDRASATRLGLEWVASMEELDRLLEESHYLFLCLPLKPETRGLIGYPQLSRMPRGAFLINAARGPVVDREGLIRALDEGRLGGAALDVFWEEPPPPGDPLLEYPNVLATPHIAGVTDVSYGGISERVADNIRRIMAGEIPENCANPHVLAGRGEHQR